jgi:hypothetical protein
MRRYRTAAETAAQLEAQPQPRRQGQEQTRAHALNYTLGVGAVALGFSLGGWLSLWVVMGDRLPIATLALVPALALLAGVTAGGLKLMEFTEEHRDWLYSIEQAIGQDLDEDGVIGDPPQPAGKPPGGALIRGVDGATHRINTDLTRVELLELKRHLLTSGRFTVRAVNGLLGDDSRASALRVELHGLGILEEPKPKAATALTDVGKRAVMRW